MNKIALLEALDKKIAFCKEMYTTIDEDDQSYLVKGYREGSLRNIANLQSVRDFVTRQSQEEI